MWCVSVPSGAAGLGYLISNSRNNKKARLASWVSSSPESRQTSQTLRKAEAESEDPHDERTSMSIVLSARQAEDANRDLAKIARTGNSGLMLVPVEAKGAVT